MDPIRWSHCGFSLLKTISLGRIAAIEKAYTRNSRGAYAAFVTAEQLPRECGYYSRFSAERCSTLYSSQGKHLAAMENA
jgi:hypothetical protein